jgi:glycosyltransferase involved in cell wall biosynthesis
VLQILEATEGGTARHLLDLLAHLPRERYQLTVLCSAGRDPAFPRRLQEVCTSSTRVEWVSPGRELSPLRDAVGLYRALRHLRRNEYDLIHTHSAKAGALGRLAAFLACPGAKRVHTPHAFPFLMPTGSTRRRLYALAERGLARITDRFIAVSEGEGRHAAALHPSARVSVVHNGIAPAPFEASRGQRTQTRQALGVASEDFLLGCVGRLTAQKGQSILLSALAILERRMPGKAKLLLVGGGEDRPALERLTQDLGIRSRVVFAGHRAEVAPFYGAMDLYVLPSLYEGCPYTLLEAMAAGLPCIATAVDGSSDIVEDGVTGRLVPAGDPQALAAEIETAIADPAELSHWGDAGRRRVRERFTLERMIAGVEQAYERTLRGGGPP